MFKKLIEKSKFGGFNISKNIKGGYSLPAILTYLIMNHYKINTLNSTKSKFSIKIIDKLKIKKWKKCFLKSAYIDEGSCGKKKVRDNLTVFSSVNIDFIKQVSRILDSLKYKYFVYRGKTVVSIILKSNKFYKEIILLLPKDYHKKVNAKILLKRQERSNNIRKQLDKIKNKMEISNYIRVCEVQKLLGIHEASARRRIKELIKIGHVKKTKLGKYETYIK